MKVTLKLFASLTDFLPADARYSNLVELNVAPGTTIRIARRAIAQTVTTTAVDPTSEAGA